MAAAALSGAPAADKASLDADAFRKLYPEDYFKSFLQDDLRPDGRVLGRARPTSIGINTITSADGSALVKQGDTMVLAGVQLSIVQPEDSQPAAGCVDVAVEVAPFSSADWRPGRAPELVATVAEHLEQVLFGRSASAESVPGAGTAPRSGSFPLRQLCITEGKAVWSASLHVYVLNVDGCVLDAVLLAAVAALQATELPATTVSDDGKARRQTPGQALAPGATVVAGRRLLLDLTPLALTCALYKEHLLVDPTAEEEGLAGSLVTVVMDEHGTLHGLFHPGGLRPVSPHDMVRCVESARLHYKEVVGLLRQSLEDARGGMDVDTTVA